jgi:hypothetical protein
MIKARQPEESPSGVMPSSIVVVLNWFEEL